jgi:DNA methylase
VDNVQRRLLERVDWDFVGSSSQVNPGLHWYPGNFVPELPGALIDILSNPGDRVFDPFGGVGTTAVAALTRGRFAVCCDANPIAVLTSYVTCNLVMLRRIDPVLVEGLFNELAGMVTGAGFAGEGLPFLSRNSGTLDDQIASLNGNVLKINDFVIAEPATAELEPWFSPKTYAQLIGLWNAILATSNSEFVRLTGAVMISSIARALSSQTRSWGHIADRVLPKEMIDKSTATSALSWLKRVRRRIYLVADAADLPSRESALTVVQNDWGNCESDIGLPRSSLLITSPPYAGAIDYTLAQRLSLHLLGYDTPAIAGLTRVEMGARRKRADKKHISNWSDSLVEATRRQIEYLEPNATAAFVMPHKDAGREIGEEALKDMMATEGWTIEFEVDRSIRQIRARQSWTSIKRETIIVFGRRGELKC